MGVTVLPPPTKDGCHHRAENSFTPWLPNLNSCSSLIPISNFLFGCHHLRHTFLCWSSGNGGTDWEMPYTKGRGGAYNWSELSECWCMFLLFVIFFFGCFKWKRWKKNKRIFKGKAPIMWRVWRNFSNLGCFTDFFWGSVVFNSNKWLELKLDDPVVSTKKTAAKNGSRDSSFNKGWRNHG